MIEAIVSEFKKIIRDCVQREAKSNSCVMSKIQFVFSVDSSGENPEYQIYKENNPLKSLTFNEVLGVKIDFKGRSLYVPKFILSALKSFQNELSCDDVKIVVFHNDDASVQKLCLYKGAAFVREVEVEYIAMELMKS